MQSVYAQYALVPCNNDAHTFLIFGEEVASLSFTGKDNLQCAQRCTVTVGCDRAVLSGIVQIVTVKRTSPDTAIHEQNGYAKVYDDKYTFKTNVDNDNRDTTYTDKHKHNMREV